MVLGVGFDPLVPLTYVVFGAAALCPFAMLVLLLIVERDDVKRPCMRATTIGIGDKC